MDVKWGVVRSKIVFGIHKFFQEREFIFADVPALVKFPGVEVNIKFFKVGKFYLHPSPEIELKKILATSGYKKVYYLGNVFRDEERDSQHLSEFTMLEWYRVGGTLEDIKRDVISLTLMINEILLDEDVKVGIKLFPVRDFLLPKLFELKSGFSPCHAKENFIKFFKQKYGKLGDNYSVDDYFFSLYLKIEDELNAKRLPFFLWYYPEFIPSLAALSEKFPSCVERFEFFIPPYEIANAYQELTGADAYRKRFELLNKIRVEKGESPVPVDEDFVVLMDMLPQTAGVALGVDRIIMALAGVDDIKEITYS